MVEFLNQFCICSIKVAIALVFCCIVLIKMIDVFMKNGWSSRLVGPYRISSLYFTWSECIA